MYVHKASQWKLEFDKGIGMASSSAASDVDISEIELDTSTSQWKCV